MPCNGIANEVGMEDNSIELHRLRHALLCPAGIIVAVAFTAILCLVIVMRIIPLGVPGEWLWEYRRIPARWSTLAPAIIIQALLLIALWRVAHKPPMGRLQILFLIIAVTMFATGMRWVVQIIESPNRPVGAFVAYTVVSPIATSYFTAARDIERTGWLNVLRDYPAFLLHQPIHAATHPPGMFMFYSFIRMMVKRSTLLQSMGYNALGGRETLPAHISAVRNLLGVRVKAWELAASFWCAQLLVILGALATPFLMGALYALLHQRANDESASASIESTHTIGIARKQLWVVIVLIPALFATAPGGIAFTQAPDQLLVLIATIAMWLVATWAVRIKCNANTSALLATAGLMAGIGTFFSFKFIPIALALVAWVIMEADRNAVNQYPRWSRTWFMSVVKPLAWFITSSVAFVVATGSFLQFDWYGTFRVASLAHKQQAVEGVRTYWKWVVVNPLEFGVSAGPGIITLFVISWLLALRIPQWLDNAAPLIAFTLVLFTLDISGIVRGEVARLWLPFLPLLCIGVGRLVVSDMSMGNLKCTALLLIGQLASALIIRQFVDVMRPW